VVVIYTFPASYHPPPEKKQWEQHLTTHLHIPIPSKNGSYTVWSKSLCSPDDYSTKNTQKYFKQFQSLTMITQLELGITDGINVSLVSVSVWRLAGDTLNITCNFLYRNQQAHRDFLITLYKLSTFMLLTSMIIRLAGTNLCFLDRGWRSCSSTGLRNISTKIGWYFLNTTIDTVKLRSTLSILTRNSGGMFAMSAHFLLLLKNWIRLKHNSCYLYTGSRSTSEICD
jgi:hypothetical protein